MIVFREAENSKKVSVKAERFADDAEGFTESVAEAEPLNVELSMQGSELFMGALFSTMSKQELHDVLKHKEEQTVIIKKEYNLAKLIETLREDIEISCESDTAIVHSSILDAQNILEILEDIAKEKGETETPSATDEWDEEKERNEYRAKKDSELYASCRTYGLINFERRKKYSRDEMIELLLKYSKAHRR